MMDQVGIHLRKITAQRERIEELEEEVRQLRERKEPPALQFPAEWRLTPCLSRGLAAMYAAPDGYLDHESAAFAFVKKHDTDMIGTVKVRITNLRNLVGRYGIQIKNRWGQGYYLPEESRAIIKIALESKRNAA